MARKTASKTKLPSTVTGRRRLLKLADLLEQDAKNKKGIKFDLGLWGYVSDANSPVSCGTSACAVGLAVASGAFKRAGLASLEGGPRLTPKFRGLGGFAAVEAFFNLNMSESSFLFDDHSYRRAATKGASGERAVAKRIRDFVAGKVSP